jgi:hypothetical protein
MILFVIVWLQGQIRGKKHAGLNFSKTINKIHEWLFFPMGRSIKDPHTPEKVGNDHCLFLQIS